ncbi:MAG TPA: hypothetical protein PKC23_04725 [Candidatus Desulfobacillus sp.]|nr:hypothetical protein [Candidatus Desulfobacillus sp.]
MSKEAEVLLDLLLAVGIGYLLFKGFERLLEKKIKSDWVSGLLYMAFTASLAYYGHTKNILSLVIAGGFVTFILFITYIFQVLEYIFKRYKISDEYLVVTFWAFLIFLGVVLFSWEW